MAGQLADLLVARLGGARACQGVHQAIGVQDLLEFIGHCIGGPVPDLDDLLVALVIGEQTAAILALDLIYFSIGVGEHLLLGRRDLHIRHGHGHAGLGGEVKPRRFMLSAISAVRVRRVSVALADHTA